MRRSPVGAETSRRAGGPWNAQVTPYLLEAIRDRTGGKSLAANVALIKNNAAIAAQVAAALSAMLSGP